MRIIKEISEAVARGYWKILTPEATRTLSTVKLFLPPEGELNSRSEGARQTQLLKCPSRWLPGSLSVAKKNKEKQTRSEKRRWRPLKKVKEESGAPREKPHQAACSAVCHGVYGGNKVEVELTYVSITHAAGRISGPTRKKSTNPRHVLPALLGTYSSTHMC